MNNDNNQDSQREENIQTLRTIIHNYNVNQRLYNLNYYCLLYTSDAADE